MCFILGFLSVNTGAFIARSQLFAPTLFVLKTASVLPSLKTCGERGAKSPCGLKKTGIIFCAGPEGCCNGTMNKKGGDRTSPVVALLLHLP
jgi:hypothetical protein